MSLRLSPRHLALFTWLLLACATEQEVVSYEIDPNEDFSDNVPETYSKQPKQRRRGRRVEFLDRPATPDESKAVEKLMVRAEALRGLEFLYPVPVHIQNKAAMKRFVKAQIDREKTERMRVRWVALGVIPASEKIEEKSADSLADQVLGYYDPKEKYLAVSEDAGYALTRATDFEHSVETRSVIVHELVHALQDQHFDLDRKIKQVKTSDETTALFALVEGDATLCSLEYTFARIGLKAESLISDPEFFSKVMNGLKPTVGAAAIGPDAMQNPILFRYRGGALFAARLTVHGGTKAMDNAFVHVPASSVEIAQPTLYMDKWKPKRLATPSIELLKNNGYKVMYEDVVGHLELAAYLNLGGVAADDVAADWSGDRFIALQHGDDFAALWVLRFNDEATAQRALTMAQDVGEAMNDPKEPVPFSATSVGHYVLVMRGVSPKLANPIAETFGRSIKIDD
ncbi:MAG TPA: hypothetical protein VHM19_17955 [Polyangiales bacterium]|nr:hypothetical protein [Polyangiales bacterium]